MWQGCQLKYKVGGQILSHCGSLVTYCDQVFPLAYLMMQAGEECKAQQQGSLSHSILTCIVHISTQQYKPELV